MKESKTKQEELNAIKNSLELIKSGQGESMKVEFVHAVYDNEDQTGKLAIIWGLVVKFTKECAGREDITDDDMDRTMSTIAHMQKSLEQFEKENR